MTVAPTPLTFRDSGEGWHLRPARRLLFLGTALLVALLLVCGAVWALVDGARLIALLLVVFAAACAALPFSTSRRRLAPTTYDGPEGRGTLLPVHAVRVVIIAALVVFGLPLLVLPVLAIAANLDSGPGELVPLVLVSLLLFAVGLLLLAGAYGGVRSRLAPSKGILLTPTAVVLRTQLEPMAFGWDVLRGVRPHWKRRRAFTDVIPSPNDHIDNWLTFEVDRDLHAGQNVLRGLARTEEPTLAAETIATDPDGALALCRYYLDHPEAREELGTPAALARFRDLVTRR